MGGDGPVPQRLLDVAADDVMQSLPVVDRWYEDLITYFALRGDADAAEGLLRAMEASGYPDLGIDLRRDFDRSQGWAALAAGDVEGGLRHLRRGVDGFVCSPCGNFTMALAHDAAGNADSSRIYWEAYVDNNWGLANVETVRPIAYRRLGEIYEAEGNNEKAVEYYNAFVELWDQADADLQPQVADIRNRIARLVGENR